MNTLTNEYPNVRYIRFSTSGDACESLKFLQKSSACEGPDPVLYTVVMPCAGHLLTLFSVKM